MAGVNKILLSLRPTIRQPNDGPGVRRECHFAFMQDALELSSAHTWAGLRTPDCLLGIRHLSQSSKARAMRQS